MKALSIKQPWASLIAHGVKDIENRTWSTKYRGRFYIHASQKPVGNDLETILNYQEYNAIPINKQLVINSGIWPMGAIIGEVDIVDCVIGHSSIWAEHSANVMRKVKGEFKSVQVPVYNWVLANPVLFNKPILNVKGTLSLWEYERPYSLVGSAESVSI